MIVPDRMKRIIKEILFESRTDEEWLMLEKEVDQYLMVLPEEQREYFVDHGAGECLSMICDGIRYERAMRSYGVEFDEDGMVINWGQLEEGERLEYIPETDEYKRRTNK